MPTEWGKLTKKANRDTEVSSELLSKETKRKLEKASDDIGTLETKSVRPKYEIFPGE